MTQEQLNKEYNVEMIIDQLKNISQIEHSRHRSPINCLGNLVCSLIAYYLQPKSLQLLSITTCSPLPNRN